MSKQKIGELLDSRGLKLPLDEGVLLSDAMVIAKVLYPDGGVGVLMGCTEGMPWTERVGLLGVADIMVAEQIVHLGKRLGDE